MGIFDKFFNSRKENELDLEAEEKALEKLKPETRGGLSVVEGDESGLSLAGDESGGMSIAGETEIERNESAIDKPRKSQKELEQEALEKQKIEEIAHAWKGTEEERLARLAEIKAKKAELYEQAQMDAEEDDAEWFGKLDKEKKDRYLIEQAFREKFTKIRELIMKMYQEAIIAYESGKKIIDTQTETFEIKLEFSIAEIFGYLSYIKPSISRHGNESYKQTLVRNSDFLSDYSKDKLNNLILLTEDDYNRPHSPRFSFYPRDFRGREVQYSREYWSEFIKLLDLTDTPEYALSFFDFYEDREYKNPVRAPETIIALAKSRAWASRITT